MAAACAVVMLLLAVFLLPGMAGAQGGAMKSVEGRVVNNDETPVADAIVYIQDSKTNNIRSFISTKDGSFRFGQLSTDADYHVWAEYKGKKSDTKVISSFSSKLKNVIELKIKS
ncbi:carboxypeptidase-like regulatory domain-containing protein [Acidipila rosea]|uniref:Carboxypeptidase family protein n=1 Tax=Acidipila rosea TaxID=768535 RepID=A0A4R1L6L5_9BACT|nr:carboxypeptidase-like regulatory domain-containing protein [Acidipila rosea]TCK72673.1 carboxypeptidase family protein [Acidipila rosea]